jgi:hypothetical protein
MLRYEVEAALEQFETAAALNPSFALGQYSVGLSQAISGRSVPSDEALTRARRLSPLDPIRFAMLATHAFNAATAGEHERAAELAQRAAGHPTMLKSVAAIGSAFLLFGSTASAQGRARACVDDIKSGSS